MRPFVPAKHLDRSKRFYFEDEWARHCMMQLMVDDLDAWWLMSNH